MVSYHGYWNYQDLVQSYDLNDTRRFPEKEKYDKNSVYGIIRDQPNYKIFTHLLRVSTLDKKADNPQFDATIFICNDDLLTKYYGDEFFMNMDRNKALNLLNFHTLNRKIGKKTLLNQNGSSLQTKREESQIMIDVLDKQLIINRQAKVVGDEMKATNGLIYIIDNLLIPENF
jgi:uncharacterized surface protein with fasciclin (FAS1) repeats